MRSMLSTGANIGPHLGLRFGNLVGGLSVGKEGEDSLSAVLCGASHSWSLFLISAN